MDKLPKIDAMALARIVDDGTWEVTIPTPKGWKCKRKGCTVDFKHKHGTYKLLYNKK